MKSAVQALHVQVEVIESEFADLCQRLIDLRSEHETIDVQLREGPAELAQHEEELTNYSRSFSDAAGFRPSGEEARGQEAQVGNEATKSGATVADRILLVVSENPKAEWMAYESGPTRNSGCANVA